MSRRPALPVSHRSETRFSLEWLSSGDVVSAARHPEFGLTQAELARTWAVVAGRTTYLPMSGEEVEQLLAPLINRLVTAVAAEPVDAQVGIEVAAELVAHDLTGASSIGRSIVVLGDGLPRLAELQHLQDRCEAAVLKVLGALASGYAEALRQRTLAEQDQVTHAVLQAKLDAEREVQISEARFRQVFSEAEVGIVISDLDGTLAAANRVFAGMVGRCPEDLVGAALPKLLHTEDDPSLGAAYLELATGELAHFRRRGRLTAARGDVAWILLAGSLLRDPDGVPTHHLIIADDLTEVQLLQQELPRQALHDRLTGLPNEHYLMSRLHDVLEGADPSVQVTLCRVNLDSFAVINDGLGRAAGESLLRCVAERLQDLVTDKRAMVARMGSDDFAILIEGDMDSRDLSLFAAAINPRLCEPVYLDELGISVSAGIGVVSRPAGGISAGELIRAADTTLRRAKYTGRGQWDLYDSEHDAQQRKDHRLAAEIPGAWECGQIDVQYQPVRRLDDGRIVALQALLRWNRTDGTVMGHSDCLALAEKTGLVVLLGRWIVEQACAAQKDVVHRRPGRSPLMRVNLTAQLSQDPDLVGVVRGALSATGVAAEQLRVGVPVTALDGGRGDVLDNVGTLVDLGAEVVLLGAAAGPGFLAHLEDLQVGAVEIAQAIVERIVRRPGDDSVFTRAIRNAITLVHSAGATVIVPEVNTAEQARWWRDARADTAWGAHFGAPVPAPDLDTLLADR